MVEPFYTPYGSIIKEGKENSNYFLSADCDFCIFGEIWWIIKIRSTRLQVALSRKKVHKKPLVIWPSSRSLYKSQTISKRLMSSYSLIVLYANFEKNTIILVILFSKLAFLDTLREFSVIQLPSSSLGREPSFLCKNFVNHFYKILSYYQYVSLRENHWISLKFYKKCTIFGTWFQKMHLFNVFGD